MFLIVAALLFVPKPASATASITCYESSNTPGVWGCDLEGNPAFAQAMTWYGPPVIAQLDDYPSNGWIYYYGTAQVMHNTFVCATPNDSHLAPTYDTTHAKWGQTIRNIVIRGTNYPGGGAPAEYVYTTITCRGPYPDSSQQTPPNPDTTNDVIWIWMERPTFPSGGGDPNGWDNIWCVIGTYGGGDGSYSGGGLCPGNYHVPPYSIPN